MPGKPSLYGTTREFLDYFNLKSLDQLPTLAEIKDLDGIHPELALDEDNNAPESEADSTEAGEATIEAMNDADYAEDDVENDVENGAVGDDVESHSELESNVELAESEEDYVDDVTDVDVDTTDDLSSEEMISEDIDSEGQDSEDKRSASNS